MTAPEGRRGVLAWPDVAALLRRRNLRLTPQRRAVVAALSEFEGHVTAAQLVERCTARDPDVVPSTVYRTLDLLQDLGLVTHIHDAEGHEEYQPAQETPHAHLICRACGTTREISGDELGDFVGQVHRRHHFDVDVSHLAIFGRCEVCGQS
ncbi:MAG: transcriptional repressor [Chloroflexi bacterium]|nr:transcriptional repressor [Chloroflexota bacterium]